MRMKGVLIAAMLLMPSAALAAPGIVTASVGMRAGPGTGFPMVDRIPAGAHVNILGCLRGNAWCDVNWSGDRGWVSSQYLEYLYRNRYVYLPDYVDVIDVPVVSFVLGSYWASHYAGRPWYQRRAHWTRYWQSHARFATLPPADRSTRVTRTETRTAIIEGRARGGMKQGAIHERSVAQPRGPQAVHGRAVHERGGRTFAAPRQTVREPMARAHGQAATRVSNAPKAGRAMPHGGQPSMARTGGSPMGAHAQMGGPQRAAPAMQQMRGGGGAHINAAPRGGGGGGQPGGGPPGRHQR